jgi:hypothetical protein
LKRGFLKDTQKNRVVVHLPDDLLNTPGHVLTVGLLEEGDALLPGMQGLAKVERAPRVPIPEIHRRRETSTDSSGGSLRGRIRRSTEDVQQRADAMLDKDHPLVMLFASVLERLRQVTPQIIGDYVKLLLRDAGVGAPGVHQTFGERKQPGLFLILQIQVGFVQVLGVLRPRDCYCTDRGLS